MQTVDFVMIGLAVVAVVAILFAVYKKNPAAVTQVEADIKNGAHVFEAATEEVLHEAAMDAFAGLQKLQAKAKQDIDAAQARYALITSRINSVQTGLIQQATLALQAAQAAQKIMAPPAQPQAGPPAVDPAAAARNAAV